MKLSERLRAQIPNGMYFIPKVHRAMKLYREVLELEEENDRLRAALTITRGQWIHSVNAKQCLKALGEE